VHAQARSADNDQAGQKGVEAVTEEINLRVVGDDGKAFDDHFVLSFFLFVILRG
jgi:hypothetical protein